MAALNPSWFRASCATKGGPSTLRPSWFGVPGRADARLTRRRLRTLAGRKKLERGLNDLVDLGQMPDGIVAARQSPNLRTDKMVAEAAQPLDVLLDRRMFVHLHIHRRRKQERGFGR